MQERAEYKLQHLAVPVTTDYLYILNFPKRFTKKCSFQPATTDWPRVADIAVIFPIQLIWSHCCNLCFRVRFWGVRFVSVLERKVQIMTYLWKNYPFKLCVTSHKRLGFFSWNERFPFLCIFLLFPLFKDMPNDTYYSMQNITVLRAYLFLYLFLYIFCPEVHNISFTK